MSFCYNNCITDFSLNCSNFEDFYHRNPSVLYSNECSLYPDSSTPFMPFLNRNISSTTTFPLLNLNNNFESWNFKPFSCMNISSYTPFSSLNSNNNLFKIDTFTSQAPDYDVNYTLKDKKTPSSFTSGSTSFGNKNFTVTLSDKQKRDLEHIKQVYKANKDRYDRVAAATGIPAELICAIHYKEGSNNFSTYLHNGDPLGKATVHVPKGIYFGKDQWEEAAIHALKSKAKNGIGHDFDSMLNFAERYNGLGYRNKGVTNPYLWAGTSNYTKGKFVRDHVYDPSAVCKRLGVAVIVKELNNA